MKKTVSVACLLACMALISVFCIGCDESVKKACSVSRSGDLGLQLQGNCAFDLGDLLDSLKN